MQRPFISAGDLRSDGRMTNIENPKVKIKARNMTVHYGDAQALHGIDLDLNANEVTALIGP